MVRAGPGLTLLITGWARTICIRVLFLPLLFVLILKYLPLWWWLPKKTLGIFCVCVYPPQTLSFFKSGSFRSYSLEEQMWHLCWLDLMKWQIIGAVPCVGSPSPHSVYCSNSAWSVCWWLFNKSLFKKIVCGTNYSKHRMQLSSWISLKPDAELNKPGAVRFL